LSFKQKQDENKNNNKKAHVDDDDLTLSFSGIIAVTLLQIFYCRLEHLPTASTPHVTIRR